MRKYKHLFFDLDHTLWDFETNANQTLVELYHHYNINQYYETFSDFFNAYQPINIALWEQYRHHKIKKDFLNIERFYRPLKAAGLDNYDIAKAFANDFITISPQKTNLIPHTLDLLDYLKHKYQMHIITNGFRNTQHTKLETSGLRPYFTHIFISENIGANKPARAFFEHAIKSANARKKESLVIGDSLEADIIGAKSFGLDTVFYNPFNTPHQEIVTKEITDLRELIAFL